MSLRNRVGIGKGNIGKIKYFLPGPRQSTSAVKSNTLTRKQSFDENSHLHLKSIDKSDISFEVLGINEVPK